MEKIDATQEILVAEVDDILIHKREWKGRWYVDIRKVFKDAKTGANIPTKKSITFRVEQLTPIISALEHIEVKEVKHETTVEA